MTGARIKALRIEKGLSQAALGDLVGVTQQSVWQWEKDKSYPDTAQLIKLVELFGVSADYLLGITSRRDIFPAPPQSP